MEFYKNKCYNKIGGYMVVNVLIEIKNIDKTFSYLVPKNMESDIKIGIRCKVPFANTIKEGFIISFNNEKILYKLKEIISLVDKKPVLNSEMLELGSYLSKKTLSTLTSCYQTMLPRALKAKNNYEVKEKYVTYIKKEQDAYDLNEKESIIMDLLKIGDITLKEARGISSYATDKLLKKNIISKYLKEEYRLKDEIEILEDFKTLNEEQMNVLKQVSLNKFKPYLLHGVTGSGKTEVYMHLIKKVLDEGKSAILLVPEISLTPQIVNNFKKRFSNIAILHSRLSEGERYDEFRKIDEGKVSIVIGARSAIFAPLKNIGIIIIDEEHSQTYKQDVNPMYSAIDVAIKRAIYHNCPVILGSATPSLESYTRAKSGVYELLEIKNRVNACMPKVTLVDMKEEIKLKNRVFSSILKEKINDRLNKGEQIIILLNRRGYTTITMCTNCGYTDKCPKCDIPLTYHLKTKKMHCHYCGYEKNKLLACPECKSTSIYERGMGTEKLEVMLKEEFKSARIVRMDIDTTKTKNAHSKIINDFESHKYDILIGTQMISKGLDFKYVSLVGVINADTLLTIPDFRSSEKTFQLISQVSGRAGRESIKGEVIIQGFNIDHYSLFYATLNDYKGFYNKEMSIRSILKYPPFYNLCLIKISGKNNDTVLDESEKIYIYLKEHINDTILGPSACALFKINNIYNYQIIIKYKDTKKIYKYVKYINEIYNKVNRVKVTIDFNPIRV